MTIEALIEQLQQFHPQTAVVLPGYEGGYNDVDIVRQVAIQRNVHTEWWYGAHEQSDEKGAEQAVLLRGDNKMAED